MVRWPPTADRMVLGRCRKDTTVGISKDTFMASLSVHSSQSTNRPPSLPLRAVPIPNNALGPNGKRDPDDDKSSKFDSYAMISRSSSRVNTSMLTAREVTDHSNFQSEGTRPVEGTQAPIGTSFPRFETARGIRKTPGERRHPLRSRCANP